MITPSLYILPLLLHFPHPHLGQLPVCFLYALAGVFWVHEIIQYLSVFVWLTAFSKMPSKVIHVVTNGKIFCFPGWIIFHYGYYTYISLGVCVFVCVYVNVCVYIYIWCAHICIHTHTHTKIQRKREIYLYLFVQWWKFRLFLYHVYYIECCDEHGGACIFSTVMGCVCVYHPLTIYLSIRHITVRHWSCPRNLWDT